MLTAQRVCVHKAAHNSHKDSKIVVQKVDDKSKTSFKTIQINKYSFGSRIGYKEVLAHYKPDLRK